MKEILSPKFELAIALEGLRFPSFLILPQKNGQILRTCTVQRICDMNTVFTDQFTKALISEAWQFAWPASLSAREFLDFKDMYCAKDM